MFDNMQFIVKGIAIEINDHTDMHRNVESTYFQFILLICHKC